MPINNESGDHMENNPLLQNNVQSSWGFPNEVLLAGVKVRNKAGGSIMVLIGFCTITPPASATFYADEVVWTKANGWNESKKIYPKISANFQRKSNSDMGVLADSEYSDYFLYDKINDQVPRLGLPAFAVVKYWSDKNQDFIHKVLSLSEIELAD